MSQSANSGDTLSKLRAMYEREITEREAAGDPLAAIHRLNLSLPWSLEACGPPITDVTLLADLETKIVGAGRLANYLGRQTKLRWIRGRRAIIDAFLEALRTSNGMSWDGFVTAYRPVFDEVERVSAIPEEELPPSPWPDLRGTFLDSINLSLSGGRSKRHPPKKHWSTSFLEINRALRVAQSVHEAACVDIWKDAFSSGRILVARKTNETWEMVPPHEFEEAPPFACPALSDIQRKFRQADAKAERVAAEERAVRRAEGRATLFDDLDDIGAKLNSGSRLFTALGSASFDRSESFVDGDDYAAIFSRQLESYFGETETPSPNPKKARGRPTLKEDVPIIEDLADRVERGELSDAAGAVRYRIKNREHWFDGHEERQPNQEYQRLYGKLAKELQRRKEK